MRPNYLCCSSCDIFFFFSMMSLQIAATIKSKFSYKMYFYIYFSSGWRITICSGGLNSFFNIMAEPICVHNSFSSVCQFVKLMSDGRHIASMLTSVSRFNLIAIDCQLGDTSQHISNRYTSHNGFLVAINFIILKLVAKFSQVGIDRTGPRLHRHDIISTCLTLAN